MAKAYDRMEWKTLLVAMQLMGIEKKLMSLIEECIATSFSILVYGSAYGFFHPQRGLRQGCLLSPFLFLIIAEVLLRILTKEMANQRIYSICITRYTPNISHLMSVDLFLFRKATLQEVKTLKNALEEYSRSKGNW